MNFSLSKKIILIILGFAFVSSLLVSVATFKNGQERIKDLVKNEFNSNAKLVFNQFNEIVSSAKNDLSIVENFPPINALLEDPETRNSEKLQTVWKKRLNKIFRSIIIHNPYYSSFKLIDVGRTNKRVIEVYKQSTDQIETISEQNKSSNESQEQYYKESIKLGPEGYYIGDIRLQNIFKQNTFKTQLKMIIVKPVYILGKITGLLAIELNLNTFLSRIHNRYQNNIKSIILTTATGEVLYNSAFENKVKTKDTIFTEVDLKGFKNNDGLIYDIKLSEEYKLLIRSFKLEQLPKYDILFKEMIIPFLLILLISVFLIFLLYSIIVLPLIKLHSYIQAVGNNLNFSARTKYGETIDKTKDEIEFLDKILKNLVEDVLEANQMIRTQSEIINSLTIFYRTDLSGKLIYFNEPFLKRTKYSYDEIIGKDTNFLTSQYHDDDFWTKMWITINDGHIWNGAIRNKDKEGNDYWLNTTIIPVKDLLGHLKEFAAVCYDITEELDAKERAQAALEMKSQFFASVSHEIKTPLNGVVGSLDLLHIKNLDAEQRHLMDILKTSVNQLYIVLGDILDFTSFEMGTFKINLSNHDLKEICYETFETFRLAYNEKPIKTLINFDQDIPKIVTTDNIRIRQVLGNLISNAYKYTDEGTIEVTVKKINDQFIEIDVSDSGKGISNEEASKVFIPFYQINDKNRKHIAGTGLGLFICQKIVKSLGGNISFKSEPGKGSVFTFSFPLIVQAVLPDLKNLQEVEELNLDLTKDLNVLIVEDNEVNLKTLKLMLNKLALRNIKTAQDGASALEMVKVTNFDIIFMDLHLSDMDGIQITKNIRAYKNNHRPHITCFSSNNHSEIMEACIASGMDDFLIKPVVLNDLTTYLKDYLKKKELYKKVS